MDFDVLLGFLNDTTSLTVEGEAGLSMDGLNMTLGLYRPCLHRMILGGGCMAPAPAVRYILQALGEVAWLSLSLWGVRTEWHCMLDELKTVV
jgi:hypothetical protein